MVENTTRSSVESDGRGTPLPQWEVFVREVETDPLSHVGSVAAADGTEAHDHASQLFGWCAVDVWLCPASALERYSTRPLVADTGGDQHVGDSDTPDDSNATLSGDSSDPGSTRSERSMDDRRDTSDSTRVNDA